MGAVSQLAGHLLVNNCTAGPPEAAVSALKRESLTVLRQAAGPHRNRSLVSVSGPSMASAPHVVALVEDEAQQRGLRGLGGCCPRIARGSSLAEGSSEWAEPWQMALPPAQPRAPLLGAPSWLPAEIGKRGWCFHTPAFLGPPLKFGIIRGASRPTCAFQGSLWSWRICRL